MKKLALRLACALLALSAAPAGAAVITFENLAHNSEVSTIGYIHEEAGFRLTNSLAYQGTYLVWGRHSGYNAHTGGATLSHNYGGATSKLTAIDGSLFTFNSIDLADVYNHGSTGNVEFRFADALNEIRTQTVTLDTVRGLETFTLNLANIRWVEFTPLTTNGRWLQMDNIVVNATDSAPVSEPAAVGLLGLGLLGIARLRRRKA